MRYIDSEEFIKENIRYKQHWNKKQIGMLDAIWQPLTENTFILVRCRFSV
jgi:hypothetical protein